jgi:hypothetical protein
MRFEPCIGDFQLFHRQGQRFPPLVLVARERATYRMLRPVHDVQVEEPIQEAHLQRRPGIGGQQALRPGMIQLQMLDDDAGLGDVAAAVFQQRELVQGPAAQPFGRVLWRVGADAAELEWSAVFVQRDQHLLRVGGEGMAIKGERHGGGLRGGIAMDDA